MRRIRRISGATSINVNLEVQEAELSVRSTTASSFLLLFIFKKKQYIHGRPFVNKRLFIL
jgi:hypothetical protein